MSIGMGLTFVPVTLIATTNVSAEDAGLASGLFNTSQQIGGALGLAVLATLAADKTASVLADAWISRERARRGLPGGVPRARRSSCSWASCCSPRSCAAATWRT